MGSNSWGFFGRGAEAPLGHTVPASVRENDIGDPDGFWQSRPIGFPIEDPHAKFN